MPAGRAPRPMAQRAGSVEDRAEGRRRQGCSAGDSVSCQTAQEDQLPVTVWSATSLALPERPCGHPRKDLCQTVRDQARGGRSLKAAGPCAHGSSGSLGTLLRVERDPERRPYGCDPPEEIIG